MKKTIWTILLALISCLIGILFYFYLGFKSKQPEEIHLSGSGLALSPNNQYVANIDDGFDQEVYLYDRDKQKVTTFEMDKNEGSTRWETMYLPGFILFMDDGNRLIASESSYIWGDKAITNKRSTIRIWDVASKKLIQIIRLPKVINQEAAVLSDGRTLICSTDEGYVLFCDIKSGKVLNSISPPFKNMNAVTLDISKDEKTLSVAFVSSSSIRMAPRKFYEKSYVVTYEVSSRKKIWSKVIESKKSDSIVNTVIFSPNNKLLAIVCDNGQMEIVDTLKGNTVRSIHVSGTTSRFEVTSGVAQIADFSPDGKFIATGGDSVNIWEVDSGKLHHSFEGLGKVRFASDGKFLASYAIFEPEAIWGDVPSDGTYYQIKLWKDY